MSTRRSPAGQRPGRGRDRRRPGRRPRTPDIQHRGAEAQPRPMLRRIRVKPPWRMSGRTAVIALVLSALALSYAYPVRTYLEQRAEIDALQNAQHSQRDRIDELEAERARWEDPAYVKAQARERLLLVEPGEELVIIIDDPGEDGDGAEGDRDSGSSEPWFDDLADSFREADQAGQ